MFLSDISVKLSYEVKTPTHFCLHLQAARHVGQHVREERLLVEPALPLHDYHDAAKGNRFVRFDAVPGPLTIAYTAQVEVGYVPPPPDLGESPVNEVPDEVLHFLSPTRYCESDLLANAAQKQFCKAPPGVARVQAVSDWIHENIEYVAGSSDATTTAQQIFVQRQGVCRDFAHLGITFCRALNIPARLVAGYVFFDEPPQDFHAVFEAWLDGRWVLFDPTRMAPVERLVRVGTGRDAKDVAFATLFGSAALTSKDIVVRETPYDPAQATELAAQKSNVTPLRIVA
ncbi:transglutaminase family protein [Pseudorhodoferax sp. Leaf267]|uniref:transglutaminase-like domain-containing protein n=1 Tax=Pseudorhodoferax sp. Leaf267 TaxID=1736316 RepID=UPI0006F8FBB5|nr:transglutaminase family protein [Pseudorhodoferax sp. Leaf267]KQP12025.1 transglutaminase [Pseudorhodoferax sp. Leaf267]